MGHADPAPPARGVLTDTPFAHLALYLYRRGDDGTLCIEEEGRGRTEVVFRKGRPVAARFAAPTTRILPGLLRLCALRTGKYEFDASDRIGDDAAAIRGAVDPYALVSAARERHTRDDVVDGVLRQHANVKLRLQPGRDISRLQLTADDRVALDLLRAGPSRVDELVAGSPRPARATRHLLYALIVTQMVAPHEEPSRAGQSQVRARMSTPPAAPSDTPAAPRGRRPSFKSVNAVAGAQPAWQRLASLRPGAMSSRPPSPTGSASSLPPRSPGPSSRAPMGPGAAVSKAPPPDAPPAERFAHAERLLALERYAAVVAVVDDLIAKDDRGTAAYHGLRALALFRQTRETDSSMPRGVVEATRRALALDPDEPHALFTRGLIFKRAGDLRRALASFQHAVFSDPDNLDAKREVMLARRRLGKGER